MFINIKILATELDDEELEIASDTNQEVELYWREVWINPFHIEYVDEEDGRAILNFVSGEKFVIDATKDQFLSFLQSSAEKELGFNFGAN